MCDPSAVRVTGPLSAYAGGFREELARLGYQPGAVVGQLQLMAHASRWLAEKGMAVGDLSPAEVDRFVECRRSAGYRNHRSAQALAPLLGYLTERAITLVPAAGERTPLEALLERYRIHLLGARGLAPSTSRRYVAAARDFLSGLAGTSGFTIEELSAGYGTEYLRRECRRLTPGSAKDLVNCLRSLLRFLALVGMAPGELAGALPTVAVWGKGSLPVNLQRCRRTRCRRCWPAATRHRPPAGGIWRY